MSTLASQPATFADSPDVFGGRLSADSSPLSASASASSSPTADEKRKERHEEREKTSGIVKESDASMRSAIASVVSCFALEPGWSRMLFGDVKAAIREHGSEAAVDIAADLAVMGYQTHVYKKYDEKQKHEGYRISHALIGARCTDRDLDTEGLEVLVDPMFREQFVVARPSPRYARLLELVPQVFVGTRAHMVAGIRLMCPEMHASLTSAGLDMPPWRYASRMIESVVDRRAPCVAAASTAAASIAAAASTAAAFGERAELRRRQEDFDAQMRALAELASRDDDDDRT